MGSTRMGGLTRTIGTIPKAAAIQTTSEQMHSHILTLKRKATLCRVHSRQKWHRLSLESPQVAVVQVFHLFHSGAKQRGRALD